jgi:hypothetical protein
MADLTSVAQTYSNAGAAITASYLGANNYKVAYPASAFGTRVLKFAKVVLSGGTPTDISTTPTISGSNFSKAVRAVQNYVELQFVGTPTSTAFVFAYYADTAQENINLGQPSGTAVASATWADMEAEVLAALGSWGSGVVTVSEVTASGASIA